MTGRQTRTLDVSTWDTIERVLYTAEACVSERDPNERRTLRAALNDLQTSKETEQ